VHVERETVEVKGNTVQTIGNKNVIYGQTEIKVEHSCM
jgi:hypothetical protein